MCRPTVCSSGSQLQMLKRVSMLPSMGSQRGEWMHKLDRIQTIEINPCQPSGGEQSFMIDVYFRRSVTRGLGGRLSRNLDCIADRTPDIRVARTYSEFTQIRSEVYKKAYGTHSSQRCHFCQGFIRYVALGSSQPTASARWFSSRAKQAEMLTTFLSQVVSLASDYPPCPSCAAQTTIVRLLCEFVLSPTL